MTDHSPPDPVDGVADRYARDFIAEFPWIADEYDRRFDGECDTAVEEVARWIASAIEDALSPCVAYQNEAWEHGLSRWATELLTLSERARIDCLERAARKKVMYG